MWILFGTNRNDHWNRRVRVIHAPQLQWLSVAFYLLTIRLLWVRMSGANLGMLVESGFVSHHWQPFIEDSWLTQQGMFTHKTQEALLCGVSGVMMLGKDCGKGYRERKIWWPASFQGPESVILLYWLVGEEGSPSNSSRLSLEDAWRGTVHNHSFMGGSVLVLKAPWDLVLKFCWSTSDVPEFCDTRESWSNANFLSSSYAVGPLETESANSMAGNTALVIFIYKTVMGIWIFPVHCRLGEVIFLRVSCPCLQAGVWWAEEAGPEDWEH